MSPLSDSLSARTPARVTLRRRLFRALSTTSLLLLLLAQFIGLWPFAANPVFAASKPRPLAAHLT